MARLGSHDCQSAVFCDSVDHARHRVEREREIWERCGQQRKGDRVFRFSLLGTCSGNEKALPGLHQVPSMTGNTLVSLRRSAVADIAKIA